ncbi:2-oxoacid dehydrogenases acyltransferase-domain-containing protein [Mycena pura]|uniref:Dihydrolipoamide acetyltransferase component of pyruvate dehydrogenase complex n=1 Tax=Mycena pura TaxID=153505 RepID=A0AAD6Y2C0_9AGAR|nr:2-oxoacid dehydrogenases acyltransferase-domain-containing protein [Mycena pura]
MFFRCLRHSPRIVTHFHVSHTRWASRKVVHTFKLADIGEGITECEVIRWSVAPSAQVASFDPLCEVQSDKASVEITSPFDGVVKELLVQEGQMANVGQGLCTIEVDEETPEGSEQPGAKEEPPTPAPTPTSRADEPKAAAPEPSVSSLSRGLHPMDPSFTPSKGADSTSLATPSVRHYARTQGVDLAQLAPGSGKGGRVEKADVDAFLSASTAPASPAAASDGQDVVVELSRTRHAMWRAMLKSLEIPHFGYSTTLDLTELHALLPLLNAHIPAHYLPATDSAAPLAFNPAEALGAGLCSSPDVPATGRYTRLTYLPFLLKTLARTMMDWPLFRASITPTPAPAPAANAKAGASAKPTLTVRPHADIALALATPTGLYTPLLRATDTRSVFGLASDVAHLSALGRRVPCGLGPAQLAAGTVSVSNVGAAGAGTGAAPVLVPGGGVAIVALGRAAWEWDVSERWWDETKGVRGARRLKMPVSWSADHRVVEGAEMAAFVEAWRGWVEAPARLIAEGV